MSMNTIDDPTLNSAWEKCQTAFDNFYRMIASGGHNNQQMYSSHHENSILFVKRYISEIDSEILKLRRALPSNSNIIIELNDIVSIISGTGCRNFSNMIGMFIKVSPSEFKTNEALVKSTRESIVVGFDMLKSCQTLQMTPDNRNSYLDNVRVFEQFRHLFESVTRKRLWGLF